MIWTTCPSCGDVELTAEDLRVDVTAGGAVAAYSFCCPACDRTILSGAPLQALDLMASDDVPEDVWALQGGLGWRHLDELRALLASPGLLEAAVDVMARQLGETG